MTVTVKNVFVAQSIDGGVYWRAPLGTEQPTDATSPLDDAFENQGTCSKDGLSVGIARSSKSEQDFDGVDYVDIQDEYNGTFKLTLMDVELESVKKTAFGDEKVTFEPATTSHGNRYHVEHSQDQLPLSSHVFWTRSGKKMKRWVVEVGRVTDIAEMKAQRDASTKLELTIKAKRNSNGNLVEEYGDDGEKLPATPTTKTVTITGSPTGGTFTLSVGGQTTSALPNNATASAVDTALEALSTVGTGNATVTGSAGGPYSVTLANGGTLTATSSLTGGTNPGVTVS
ncbi:hypothetical protein [Williamsia serinedens]|uniref:Major tail protein n=1 Tax=Williamsia serinedens TaxID=391736 RepID=A0ABT1H5Z3_9NOCA|nr:hypothetical protein [Williamsia serinedens]MCP2162659.1 hypothetical protein [Williamsia serinedens]